MTSPPEEPVPPEPPLPPEASRPPLTLVVPPLDGPPTGGTRYNRALVDALRGLGRAPRVLDLAQAEALVTKPGADSVWVDSLWLPAVTRLARLARRATPARRVGLLAHWLPSLVTYGERPPLSALSQDERDALEHAGGVCVPSEYLARELVGLGVDPQRVRVVEPGNELPVAPRPAPPRRGSLLAVVVANVTEGKGVLPLLERLAARLRSDDGLELRVVGDLRAEADYARRCAALVESTPALRSRVRLVGSCPHLACVQALLRADVLVSASRMESYGMALADARAAGRPIIARRGGNVAQMVGPRTGGELVDDEDAVAAALLALARDRDVLYERQARAWVRRVTRPWSAAARELLGHLEHWPPPPG